MELQKTKNSKRDILLLPNVVQVLMDAKPLNVGAEMPVFTSEKNGLPINDRWGDGATRDHDGGNL